MTFDLKPLALAVAPFIAAASWAQADRSLQTVVITASNRAQSIADVQAAVQVISQQELQRYAGTSLTEALMLAAGVDARPNGANSTLAIRGIITNAGSPVLVLVDGLRRTAKYAGTNLNLIALEDVERIEIIRGPMSALYGANATLNFGLAGAKHRVSVEQRDRGLFRYDPHAALADLSDIDLIMAAKLRDGRAAARCGHAVAAAS